MLAPHARDKCLELYPETYRARVPMFLFPNLPFELSYMIHSLRSTTDLYLPLTEMKSILGYGQSRAKDDALDLAFALPDIPWLMLDKAARLLQPIQDLIDKQVALAIISRAPVAICLLQPWISTDREVGMLVVRKKGICLAVLHSNLQTDREVVTIAYRQDYSSLQYAGPSLLRDREFVRTLLQREGRGLQFVSLSLRRDKELCMIACHQDWRAYFHVDASLKNDGDIRDIVSLYDTILRSVPTA